MVDKDELMNVAQLGAEFGLGESTTRKLIRVHQLTRYKLPGSKTDWIRREDFARAMRTAVPAAPKAQDRQAVA